MPAVVIPCPHCGKELKLRDESLIGKKGKCPGCAKTFRLEIPTEPDEVELELVSPAPSADSAPAPEGDLIAPVPVAGGVDRMREIRRKNRKRRNVGIIAGGLLALAIVGSFFFIRAEREKSRREKLAAEQNEKPKRSEAYVSEVTQFREAGKQFDLTSPTAGDPVFLRFMPAGARVIVNLHPDFFWKPGTRGEEFRYCLGPLGEWVGGQIQKLARFEPEKIDEMMICVIPGLRNQAPEVAALVHLAEAPAQSELTEKFRGEQLNVGQSPEVYLVGEECFIQIDLQTFAVGPSKYAQEMVDSMNSGAQTDPDVEQILLQTDRERHLTVVFDPTILRVEQETWFPEATLALLNQALDWVGDDVKAVAWSLHLGEERFYSQMTVRGDQVLPPSQMAKKFKKRIDELPYRVLSAVEMMEPTAYGKRRIISRFPAMTKAFALATLGGTEERGDDIRLNTVLNERAAPNLALGTLLAWDESTRTDFNRSSKPAPAVASNDKPQKELTLAEKLAKKIEIDFRKTPLQDAMAYISDESGIPIKLDGAGLKATAFTQNMTQELKLENVTVKEAIRQVITGAGNLNFKNQPDQAILILDESGKGLILTTKAAYTNVGKKPPPCQVRS